MTYKVKSYRDGDGMEDDMNSLEKDGWSVVSVSIPKGSSGNMSSYSALVVYHKA